MNSLLLLSKHLNPLTRNEWWLFSFRFFFFFWSLLRSNGFCICSPVYARNIELQEFFLIGMCARARMNWNVKRKKCHTSTADEKEERKKKNRIAAHTYRRCSDIITDRIRNTVASTDIPGLFPFHSDMQSTACIRMASPMYGGLFRSANIICWLFLHHTQQKWYVCRKLVDVKHARSSAALNVLFCCRPQKKKNMSSHPSYSIPFSQRSPFHFVDSPFWFESCCRFEKESKNELHRSYEKASSIRYQTDIDISKCHELSKHNGMQVCANYHCLGVWYKLRIDQSERRVCTEHRE